MKLKKIFILVVVILISFICFIASNVFSGEIKQSFKVEGDKEVHRLKPMVKNPFHIAIEEMLDSLPDVSNKIEAVYDINEDKKLQKEEIKKFLRDIRFVLRRRGWIKINSELLRVFDKNEDGRITQFESPDIKKYMR